MGNHSTNFVFHAFAPMRIDLAGGPTDIPEFVVNEGGSILNAAINKYSNCFLSMREDNKIVLISEDFNFYTEARNTNALRLGSPIDLLLLIIRRFGPSRGIVLLTKSDLPPLLGLGGSGSIGMAVLGALNSSFKRHLSKQQMAEIVHLIERKDLKMKVGRQDQYVAAYGGINLMEFKNGSVNVMRLKLPRSKLKIIERSLFLCYAPYLDLRWDNYFIKRYLRGDSFMIEILRNLKRLAYDMQQHMLNADIFQIARCIRDAGEYGKELDLQLTKKDLRYKIIDTFCKNKVALAGKTLGKKCLLFICEPKKIGKLFDYSKMLGLKYIRFRFEDQGLQVISMKRSLGWNYYYSNHYLKRSKSKV